MKAIGYGITQAKMVSPTQMGAIDELSSSHSSEGEILPPSLAPQGFLNFQASMSPSEKQEQMLTLAQIQNNPQILNSEDYSSSGPSPAAESSYYSPLPKKKQELDMMMKRQQLTDKK